MRTGLSKLLTNGKRGHQVLSMYKFYLILTNCMDCQVEGLYLLFFFHLEVLIFQIVPDKKDIPHVLQWIVARLNFLDESFVSAKFLVM